MTPRAATTANPSASTAPVVPAESRSPRTSRPTAAAISGLTSVIVAVGGPTSAPWYADWASSRPRVAKATVVTPATTSRPVTPDVVNSRATVLVSTEPTAYDTPAAVAYSRLPAVPPAVRAADTSRTSPIAVAV